MRKTFGATVRGGAAIALAAGLLAAAGSASARNDRLLLPIAPVLQGSGLAANPRADVPLQFGGATGVAGDALAGVVQGSGRMDPFGQPQSNYGGSRVHRSDLEVCQDAFRKALAQLQQHAAGAGGVAVVGIVSDYKHQVFDSASEFECHVGASRAVVELRGQASRALPAATASH